MGGSPGLSPQKTGVNVQTETECHKSSGMIDQLIWLRPRRWPVYLRQSHVVHG